MKREQKFLSRVGIVVITILMTGFGSQASFAQTEAISGGEAISEVQGMASTIEKFYSNPIVEQGTIVVANQATLTPTFFAGPISTINNIGGFRQIIPTITSVVQSNGPTFVAIIVALVRGAAYG